MSGARLFETPYRPPACYQVCIFIDYHHLPSNDVEQLSWRVSPHLRSWLLLCVKIRFYLVFHACIRRRLIKHPSDPQIKLLGLTTCFILIHTTSCYFVALAHTICALFYLHPSTPLDGDSPNFSALTSDLLLYTYAHQVDVKSHKLSPYVCKMDRGA